MVPFDSVAVKVNDAVELLVVPPGCVGPLWIVVSGGVMSGHRMTSGSQGSGSRPADADPLGTKASAGAVTRSPVSETSVRRDLPGVGRGCVVCMGGLPGRARGAGRARDSRERLRPWTGYPPLRCGANQRECRGYFFAMPMPSIATVLPEEVTSIRMRPLLRVSHFFTITSRRWRTESLASEIFRSFTLPR